MDLDLQLEIVSKRVYRGPNLYHYDKAMLVVVDIGDLEDFPSMKLKGFNERLLKLIPSLDTHTCSLGVPGGFIRRLTEDEGTWMGHIFEHVAIEIQNLAGIDVSFGKTRQRKGEKGRTGKESVYNVVFEYKNEETALSATTLAQRTVNYCVDPKQVPDFDFEKELKEVIEIAQEFAYGPSTGAIVAEAERRGIPTIRLQKRWSLVQFGWGNRQKRIWASTSSMTPYIATEIAQEKELTLQMLYDVGIPVPRGGEVRTYEGALEEVRRIGYPVVTKPSDVSHGRGVYLNIRDDKALKKGFEIAKEYSRDVIVEQYIEGNDYRVLVINGEFVAAAQRIPAHVIGDGEHTIEELVEIVNQDPRRGIGHEKVLTQIVIDQPSLDLLEAQGLTLSSIPEKGRFVQLKSTANLSTGGTAIDVTDIIHYDNIRLAERAVKTIGLDIAGVDIIAEDISKPILAQRGVIIEVNAAPGLRMHLEPTEGTPRNVAKPIVDMLFPDGDAGRIPLIAVTGTNGKTTVSRWIAHVLKLAGKKVGLTTTDGIYIDGELQYSGDCTGPWSAKAVLKDPTVNFAVLETARGGIIREGLGWDFCDVGCLLNVSEDHLGLGGVKTLDDLADVKAVVLDQVKKDVGYGVINADDPLVMERRGRIRGKTVLISLDYRNQDLQEHVETGGDAVTITPNGVIQLIRNNSQTPILHVKEIPACYNGHAVFNIVNAMFVVGATFPFVSVEDIRTGLSSFNTSFSLSPGRMNIEYVKGARVVIDYGHNPEALKAQIQLIEGLHKDQNHVGRKAIVFGMPGDRPNQTIINAAKIVANHYDRYFLKEDWNLRGRKSGEVPQLIAEILMKEGVSNKAIEIFAGEKNELDAVTALYEWLQLNDLAVIQADDIPKVRHHLLSRLAKMKDTTFETMPVHEPRDEHEFNYERIAEYTKRDEPSD
ncbi:MAG: cyanophycin synthetase [Methanobacteriota archaeon]|nr:MAG: cyanophycin synthetase [Euryarchaeota archaeon]